MFCFFPQQAIHYPTQKGSAYDPEKLGFSFANHKGAFLLDQLDACLHEKGRGQSLGLFYAKLTNQAVA